MSDPIKVQVQSGKYSEDGKKEMSWVAKKGLNP